MKIIMILSFLSGALFLFGLEMLALAWFRSRHPAATEGYIDKPVVALGAVSLISSAALLVYAIT